MLQLYNFSLPIDSEHGFVVGVELISESVTGSQQTSGSKHPSRALFSQPVLVFSTPGCTLCSTSPTATSEFIFCCNVCSIFGTRSVSNFGSEFDSTLKPSTSTKCTSLAQTGFFVCCSKYSRNFASFS